MQKIFWIVALGILGTVGYMGLRDQFERPETDLREEAAYNSIQTLIDAQAQYRSKYARYAERLQELGPPPGGGAPSEQAAGLIPGDLASGRRFGYQFQVRSYGATFKVNASPLASTDTPRHFYGDQTGVIRYSDSGQANEGSEPVR